MSRTLPFPIRKPLPAKATLDAQRRSLRVLKDLQVLSRIAPDDVVHLEHYAADLRLRAELAVRTRSERA